MELNFDSAREMINNMHKTIHFSRYCWSGYLPKEGTEKTSHREVAAALLKYLH